MQDQDSHAITSSGGEDLRPLTKELSVLDGLYVLARHKWLIILLPVVGIFLGVVVAIITPEEYASSAVLMRETQQESSRTGLAALRGLGLNIGESQSGLTIEAYPNVLASHEVRSILLEERFPTSSGAKITFLEYARNVEPGSIGERLRTMLRSDPDGSSMGNLDDSLSLSVAYSYQEQQAMETMGEMIGVDADAETGLMTITVTAQDPVLAASLVGRLIEELRSRVQSLLTQKAREDYEFIGERTTEAEGDLRTARARLAHFDDRNRGLTSAQLLAERDRLRQEVSFATEVFSQYQGELKQAEIEVQRASPVITVLDRPVVPLRRVRPRRTVIVLVGALFGLAMGLLLSFIIEGFKTEADTAGGKRKSAAIREALVPSRFRRMKPTRTKGELDVEDVDELRP